MEIYRDPTSATHRDLRLDIDKDYTTFHSSSACAAVVSRAV
jgi:hypothetical protein